MIKTYKTINIGETKVELVRASLSQLGVMRGTRIGVDKASIIKDVYDQDLVGCPEGTETMLKAVGEFPSERVLIIEKNKNTDSLSQYALWFEELGDVILARRA